jgi:hypothetical protein
MGRFLKSMGSLDYDLCLSIGGEIMQGPSLVAARIAGKYLRGMDGESIITSARPSAPTKQRKAILDNQHHHPFQWSPNPPSSGLCFGEFSPVISPNDLSKFKLIVLKPSAPN